MYMCQVVCWVSFIYFNSFNPPNSPQKEGVMTRYCLGCVPLVENRYPFFSRIPFHCHCWGRGTDTDPPQHPGWAGGAGLTNQPTPPPRPQWLVYGQHQEPPEAFSADEEAQAPLCWGCWAERGAGELLVFILHQGSSPGNEGNKEEAELRDGRERDWWWLLEPLDPTMPEAYIIGE